MSIVPAPICRPICSGYSGVVVSGRQRRLGELCARHGVTSLYAYGSRAVQALHWLTSGGAFAPGSNDLDLAVSSGIDQRYSLAQKVALAAALADLFEFEAIDLADMAEVDPFVAANIVRGERLYCADRLDAEELELYVLRRAGDLAPFERERLAAIAAAADPGAGNE